MKGINDLFRKKFPFIGRIETASERKEAPPERERYRSVNATKMLFDYYFAELLASIETRIASDPSFSDYRTRLEGGAYTAFPQIKHDYALMQHKMIAFLKEYLLIAVNSELRATYCRYDKSDINSFYQKGSEEDIRRFFSVAAGFFKNHVPSTMCNYCGGPKWAPIASSGEALWNNPTVVDIDHAVDWTHNSDCLFNKDSRVEEVWAGATDREFLDAKKEFKSALEMVDFFLSRLGDGDKDSHIRQYLQKRREYLFRLDKLLASQAFLRNGARPLYGALHDILLGRAVEDCG